MSMAHFNNQVWSDLPSTFFLPWLQETSPANTAGSAIYLRNHCSAFDLRIFEDPAVTILLIPSDPEASPFIIEGQVIPPSSTYPASLAEWFPTHPQADFTFANGWHLHAHCFFLAHVLHCFEAWVGTNEACDLPTALADFMVHLEPSLSYIFTNWIARVNCPTFAIFHYCLAFSFLAKHTFLHFHCFWLDPLNPGADFLQVVQARILELGVTMAMPTPIPFDPMTAEGFHLALSLLPQDLEVFPPALLAPRNIISSVSVPPPPKVDSPAKPAAATNSSSNGESKEEEDELEPSPPKRSTVSRKHCCSPSVASSNHSEVSSPESEAPIAKKIPTTRSTIAKANLTSNPKGKQKAHARSTSLEISAPTKCFREEVKPAAKVKKNGKKADPAFTNSLLFPPRDDLEDFPSLQVNSKGLNNTLPLNLQVPFFDIEPRLSDLGVVFTYDHVGYTLEELQLVNHPLDSLGSELVSCIPCQICNIKCSPNMERLGDKCAPCITGKQPCNLGCGMAEYLEGLDCVYWHLDQCPATFQDVLSEAQWLRVIHGHAVDNSRHHQELIRQIEYDFLTTMDCLQSAGSDTAIVLHQLVQSAPERVHLSLDNLSFLAMVFGWNSIFNLPELSASLEVRDQLLRVGKEDEPGGSPVDLSSGEPSGLGSVQVPDAVASGVEANTQPDTSASSIVQDDILGQVAGPLSAVPDSRDTTA
ncbi:hypothetical protein BT96DRAFT_1002364 [Gymnopus androsaceus JB14]|uniref:Uncharacterized protein n=1 Tax=Gymnopus androsaceus JB14 TaxID=1447944 RepID=A0A6A4GZA8_9AGAR|nr:hypothetical protein BT96DRAFT_1002364 [Gymnopus androsaceus JB14]